MARGKRDVLTGVKLLSRRDNNCERAGRAEKGVAAAAVFCYLCRR